MRLTHDSNTMQRPHGLALSCALALLLSVVFLGCDHATESDGPSLIVRFGEFELQEPLSASRDSVDFAMGESVSFSARFNKPVNWTVEITGQESGAIKRVQGFSNELNAENARWVGGTTELPLFREESVSAVLLIPDEDFAGTDTTRIEVLSERTYPGEVVTGFEADSEADIFLGNFEFEFAPDTGPSSEVPAAEGELFYLLRSTGGPVVADPFFIGLIDITPDGGGTFAVPTTVPEDLYFNFFLYGFGTPNTIAVIQVIADANGTGTYEADQDAVFGVYDMPVEGEGWEAVSVAMSETDITQAQAEQIVAIRVLLISDNNGQPEVPLPVDFGIDYITFTAGGPLRL